LEALEGAEMELSAAPASRLLTMDLQSPRAEGRAESAIDVVFAALDKIIEGEGTSGVSPCGEDIRKRERNICRAEARQALAPGGLYAPAAAAALRDRLSSPGLAHRATSPSGASVSSLASTAPSDNESHDLSPESAPESSHPQKRIIPIKLPVTTVADASSEDRDLLDSLDSLLNLDTARTGVSDVLNSAGTCYTEMSQMLTPRAQPGSGGASAPPQKMPALKDEPSTATASRLFKAAEGSLGQIDEDTDAELEMLKEQQQMIEQLCRLKAEAFMAKEREKFEEKKREREQMHLMRVEQLQLIRMQEARKADASRRRPTTAPVRRTSGQRPVESASHGSTADDVLDASCCTETLSPGVRTRAPEPHETRCDEEHRADSQAWASPERQIYTPKRAAAGGDSLRGHRPASASEAGSAKVTPRPKSALSRLITSLGTKRFRAPVVPLPKSLVPRFVKGKSKKDAWSDGIPIVPNRYDSDDDLRSY